MSISLHIEDPASNMKVAVVDGDEVNALAVATRPLKVYDNRLLFFINDDYGIDMNQDASAGGTPDEVHNGIDTTLWTATDVVGGGKTTFDLDDEHAHAGAITIVNANNCGGDTQTVEVNGVPTTKTEGVDWNLVGGDNDGTATALATELSTISGVTASATGAIVSIVADNGDDITEIDTSDAVNCPGSARAVRIDNSPVSDVFQFAKGGDVTASNYISLSMWIYVDKDWKAGDNIEVYGWDVDTGTQVGNAVSLQNYFSWGSFDVWQKISIPLTDFGTLAISTTLNALRIKIAAQEGKSPKWYLDDIQFEQTGTPIEYNLEPSKGTWLHVKSLQIVMADAYSGTLANATMPNIPYDSILGMEALAVGIVYRRVQDNSIITTFNIKKFVDFMGLSNAAITGSGSDGTNTWVSVNVKFNENVILKSEDKDKMSLTISEDLSQLLFLRVGVGAKEEERDL